MRVASIPLVLAMLAAAARAGEPPKTTPGEIKAKVKFVTITGSGGWKLAAFCAEPAGKPAKARPAVILTHMLGRQKDDWLPLVPRLTDAGFVVVAYDMRGHGKSVGEDGKPKPWRKFLASDWAAAEKDVAAVRAWLLKEKGKEVDGKRIALTGASIGANLSLRALRADPSLRGAVLLSAGLVYKGVKTAEGAAKLAAGQKLAIFATAGDSRGYCAMTAGKLSKAAGRDKVVIEKVYKGSEHGTGMFGKVKGVETEIIKALKTITAPAPAGDDVKSALDRIL